MTVVRPTFRTFAREMRMMKTVRKLISWCVGGLVALTASLMVALRLPAVQEWAGGKAAAALGAKLGTEVSIGRGI